MDGCHDNKMKRVYLNLHCSGEIAKCLTTPSHQRVVFVLFLLDERKLIKFVHIILNCKMPTD